jgi:hypothetical protein
LTAHRRKVLVQRQAFTERGFAVGDGAADLSGNLLVQQLPCIPVNIDVQHGTSDNSSIVTSQEESWQP